MNIGKLRGWLAGLLAVVSAVLLVACGGGGGSAGTVQVRLLNATVGAATLDLYLTDVLLTSGVANNTVSAYRSTDAATYTAKVTLNGSTTAYGLTANPALAKDTAYTVVSWGLAGATQTFYFPDNEAVPTVATNAKIRFFNTSIDAGALDLYLTGPSDDLTNLSPVASSISGGRFSSYTELAAGTYRLRVTASGSKTDIRLDMPEVTLNALDIMTFITQPTQGGALVAGLQLLQQGGVRVNSQTLARARVVASLGNNAAASVSVAATSLNVVNGKPVTSLSSPLVGDYVLVAAGDQTVTVNGNVLASNQTFAVGGDYTLLVYGSPAAPQLSLITDDNQLLSNAANAKLRLVNGLSNQGNLSMKFNFDAVANNVASGAASDFSEVLGGSAIVDVTSSATNTSLFSTAGTGMVIPGQRVYTMFMLDGAGSSGYLLHRER